jgi:hypothetical protein
MDCKITDKASGAIYDADDYLNRLEQLNNEAYQFLEANKNKLPKQIQKSDLPLDKVDISTLKNEYKFLDIGNFAPELEKITASFDEVIAYFKIAKNSNIEYAIRSLNDPKINLKTFTLKSQNPTLHQYYSHLENMLRIISTDGVKAKDRQFLLTALFVAAIENEKDGLDKMKDGIDKYGKNSMGFYLSLVNTASKDKALHNLTLQAMANAYRYIRAKENSKWGETFSNALMQFTKENNVEAATNNSIKDILTGIYGKALVGKDLEDKINVIKAAIKEKDNNNKPSECE